MYTVRDVRDMFASQWEMEDFLTSPKGVKTYDLSPVTFIADEPAIFGEVNEDYVKRELEWYNSQSRFVRDIPGGPPQIWKQVASKLGTINSNYGWAIYSEENGSQYDNVKRELLRDPTSRRAIMIYTRPTMHVDQHTDGMQDFMCTNTVQYWLRDEMLSAHVSMRSNDAVFGYKNDRAWQMHVLEKLALELEASVGDLFWTAGSLHVYERHWYLIDHFAMTDEHNISKEEFDELRAT